MSQIAKLTSLVFQLPHHKIPLTDSIGYSSTAIEAQHHATLDSRAPKEERLQVGQSCRHISGAGTEYYPWEES